MYVERLIWSMLREWGGLGLYVMGVFYVVCTSHNNYTLKQLYHIKVQIHVVNYINLI